MRPLGAAVLTAGMILLLIGITPTQIQEGATTQWTPSPGITGATVTAAKTF